MAALPNDADARIAPADKRAAALSDAEFREFARRQARRTASPATTPVAAPVAAVNPYAAPSARVEDAQVDAENEGKFTLAGVAVPARNGVECLAGAIAMFKEKPTQWLTIVFAFAVINVFANLVPALSVLFYSFFYMAFYGGLMIAAHRHATEDTLGIGDLFAGFQRAPGKLIGAAFVTCLVLLGGAITAIVIGGFGLLSVFSGGGLGGASIGAVFLIIPIMFVSLFIYCAVVWFTPALIALEDVGIIDAIGASFKACLRNFGAMSTHSVVLAPPRG